VLAGPREKFTENEINHLKKYLESGGSILVLLGEGGEKRFNTNINFFLEEYGIMINRFVIRRVLHKTNRLCFIQQCYVIKIADFNKNEQMRKIIQ
jgi:hypothetical protein